ncbi:MAG: hypothetical protein Tsb009_18490 [Planctomycetaceae bacterium]
MTPPAESIVKGKHATPPPPAGKNPLNINFDYINIGEYVQTLHDKAFLAVKVAGQEMNPEYQET